MAKYNSSDEYDQEDLPREPDGSEEEQTYSFQEEYARQDGGEPAWDDAPEEDAPASDGEKKPGKAAALRRKLDKRQSGGEKKPRGKKARQADGALDVPEQIIRQAPTVGRTLKSRQMLVYDSELDEVDYNDPDDVPEVRDYLPIRFRRYGRLGIGGGVMYALCVISISIILACFGWMCAVDVLALNKEPATAVVVIDPYEPTGDMPVTVAKKNDEGVEEEVPIKVDIDQVADALKNGGIIEYKWLFKIFSRFSNANIKIDPGTYDLSTVYDYRALVTKMQVGSDRQLTTQVTFPEGFTMDQIFTLLEQNYVCGKDELYETAANYDFDYDFLKDIPLGDASRLEGFLFPDTYEFYQGESPVTAIERLLSNADRRLSSDIITGISEHGLSLREGIIMASLIEKEAGGAEGERENIASVIYNRLNAGWTLDIDSTVNYIKGTNTLDLTQEDLAIDDPYNTYVYKGLPPGPICNPGLAAIEAVANPTYTNYWYWYSVNGETYFFATADEQYAFAQANPY